MKQRFRAKLETDDPRSGTAFVVIPFDVKKVFGASRAPVRGTLNGFEFQSTLSPYGGVHYLGVNQALRAGAHVQVGDSVTVVLERDETPRTVTPPADLARALQANPAARAAWTKLSHTQRKEYAQAVSEAKKPETRARRVEKIIAELLRK